MKPYLALPSAALLFVLVGCSGSAVDLKTHPIRREAKSNVSCSWPGVAPETGDITYVKGTRLFAVGTSRDEPVCLLDGAAPTTSRLLWGPLAERVLLAPHSAVLPSGTRISPHEPGGSTVWSRPGGKSILGITEGRLMKRRTIEERAVDISFLSRHDEAVYHPAGIQIISIGLDAKGTYGLFMATNVGERMETLAISEEAERIFSLKVRPGGEEALFVADHGSYWDVHALDLETGHLRTLYSTPQEVVGITDTFETERETTFAVQIGSCSKDTSLLLLSMVSGRRDPVDGLPPGSSLEPVGWLGNGSLAILARRQGCSGAGDLYLTSDAGSGHGRGAGRAALIERGVAAAGVREVSAPPPPPFGSPVDPPAA